MIAVTPIFFRAVVIRNSSCADRRVVLELGEDAAERVQRDASGADLAHRVLDPGEQGAEVVAAGDSEPLAGLRRGVDERPAALRPPTRAMSQPNPRMLRRMSSGVFLERDENPAVAGPDDPRGQELGGEHRLGAPGGARDQASTRPWGRPPLAIRSNPSISVRYLGNRQGMINRSQGITLSDRPGSGMSNCHWDGGPALAERVPSPTGRR